MRRCFKRNNSTLLQVAESATLVEIAERKLRCLLGVGGGLWGGGGEKWGGKEDGLLRLIARISTNIPNLSSPSPSVDATLPPKEQDKQKSFQLHPLLPNPTPHPTFLCHFTSSLKSRWQNSWSTSLSTKPCASAYRSCVDTSKRGRSSATVKGAAMGLRAKNLVNQEK